MNDTSPSRYVVVVTHATRDDAFDAAAEFISEMAGRGIGCAVPDDQVEPMSAKLPQIGLEGLEDFAHEAEVVVVFGGDGTLLRAAEWSLPRHVPMIGVNLGHVGFLAELERSDMADLVNKVCSRDYTVEDRLVLKITVTEHSGQQLTLIHI